MTQENTISSVVPLKDYQGLNWFVDEDKLL